MKKIMLCAAVALLPFLGFAQSNYTITGNLAELKVPATVYLALVKDGRFVNVDSVQVKNGQFRLSGSVEVPQQAILALTRHTGTGARQGADHLGFFIENSDMQVSGTDSIKNAQLAGSVSDRQQRELEQVLSPITAKITGVYAIAEGMTPEEKKVAADSVVAWVAAIKQARVDFAENNLDSYMGMYTFNLHVLDSKFEPESVEPLYHRFSPALKASPLGQEALAKIENAKRRQTGVLATDFTQNDLDDKPFKLSSLRGKYVLVDFWASWCAPCRAENPHLVKAYAAYKDKNFEIVGVSLDQNKAAWENAIEMDKLPWIHVSDLKGWKNEVAALYDIRSVPQNLLVDPQGMIVAKNLRGEALEETLSALLSNK